MSSFAPATATGLPASIPSLAVLTPRRGFLRGLVAAAPAAIVAASLPALAACSNLDAELLALRPEWIATRARFEAALDSLNEAEARFGARQPKFPDLTTYAGSYAEYRAEHQRIRKVWDALEVETGVVTAHELEDLTSDADSAMVERIAATPARTRDGLRFKREVLRDWQHCERDDLKESITADLLAMVGGLDA